MTALDHTNADWAHGPALTAWLDTVTRVDLGAPKIRKRVFRWRCGALASFWLVDEMLSDAGMHVSQVPCEIWCLYDNGRGAKALDAGVPVAHIDRAQEAVA